MWILGFRRAIGWLVRTESVLPPRLRAKSIFTTKDTKGKNERTFTTKFTKITKVLKSKSFFTTKVTKDTKGNLYFGVGPRYIINISGLSLQK